MLQTNRINFRKMSAKELRTNILKNFDKINKSCKFTKTEIHRANKDALIRITNICFKRQVKATPKKSLKVAKRTPTKKATKSLGTRGGMWSERKILNSNTNTLIKRRQELKKWMTEHKDIRESEKYFYVYDEYEFVDKVLRS